MSLKQGTQLRNGKIVNPTLEESISPSNVMANESNVIESDTNYNFDIFSQLIKMRKNNEKKIIDLHSKFSELRDLMMAIMNKTNEENIPSSSRGLSKQPQVGSDSGTMPRLLQQEISVFQQPKHQLFVPKGIKRTFHLSKETPQIRAPWRRAGTLKIRTRPTTT